MKNITLRISNVNKWFGPTHALDSVSLDLYEGEIRGLIGENGSGKSTLSCVITGVVHPDEGSMTLLEKPYKPHSMLDADKQKINMIVQEMATIDNITVAANFFTGKESQFRTNGIISRKKMNKAALAALERIGVTDIDPANLINRLSFEDRKLVEMARAINNDPQILIVDETTTALSQKGRSILYRLINEMKEKGKTVLFISHDLSEVMEHCDAVSVMRDGKMIKTLNKDEMTVDAIRFHMIGRKIDEDYYRSDTACTFEDEVVFKLEDVCALNTVRHISLELHKGEIFGIGGLTDCGMHDVGKVAFGLLQPNTGKVTAGANVKIINPMIAIKNKIGYMSKNRDQEALALSSTIKQNISLPSANRLKKGFIIPKTAENRLAKKMGQQLSIKMNSINQHCMYLSGGNKQKVVLAKWLGNESEILILDCPTRGIDIGVKQAIYKLMQELKASGKAILMISEELPELIGMCDRISIMKDGKITKTFDRDGNITEADLIQCMI